MKATNFASNFSGVDKLPYINPELVENRLYVSELTRLEAIMA
jgi:hypothetical protein